MHSWELKLIWKHYEFIVAVYVGGFKPSSSGKEVWNSVIRTWLSLHVGRDAQLTRLHWAFKMGNFKIRIFKIQGKSIISWFGKRLHFRHATFYLVAQIFSILIKSKLLIQNYYWNFKIIWWFILMQCVHVYSGDFWNSLNYQLWNFTCHHNWLIFHMTSHKPELLVSNIPLWK